MGFEIGWQQDMNKLKKKNRTSYMSILLTRGKDSIEINSVRAGVIFLHHLKSPVWWETLKRLA